MIPQIPTLTGWQFLVYTLIVGLPGIFVGIGAIIQSTRNSKSIDKVQTDVTAGNEGASNARKVMVENVQSLQEQVAAGNLDNKVIVARLNQVQQVVAAVKEQTDGLTQQLVKAEKVASRESGIREGIAQEQAKSENGDKAKAPDPDRKGDAK